MCLAIPGKVKSIEGKKAIVKYPEEERQALVGEDNINAGDYVMVQMGIIVKKIDKEQAEFALEAWTKKD
ncbi:HypC/HybG/HupF family hydrogenase formation chaperone [Patescibacteria group bacterium]